jgi:hypothetical protein
MTDRARLLALAALAAVLGGCADLEVTNPNSPTGVEAAGDAAAVEAAITSGYHAWFEANYTAEGGEVGRLLSTTSFQHSSPFCAPSYYSTIPRAALPAPANAYYEAMTGPWYALYDALVPVAFALRTLTTDPSLADDMGADERDRLMAFGRFVQGLGHGTLALLYDRAAIVDEVTLGETEDRLVEYRTVMERALGYLYDAAERSAGADWPAIPAEWMTVEVTPDRLARLAHSYAARLRAAVARLPHHRATVDWNAVLADVDAGVTESWLMDMDYDRDWFNAVVYYGSRPDWGLETYFILGMADQSGSYQQWLLQDLFGRVPNPDLNDDGTPDPLLIETPDTRFPQGATLAEQEASPGSLYVIPNGLDGDRAWDIRQMWLRPDRGTWRWSYYWNVETEPYWRLLDPRWPEVSIEEMRLLKAEALLRRGQEAEAAALINVTRTAAGLSPTDASGSNPECVPRLPDGYCGDLLEMLKWEKRLETRMKGLLGAPWYFDARGWGDLYAGTFLQFPVPCEELTRIGEPCPTFGGPGGQSASPGSVYPWGDG